MGGLPRRATVIEKVKAQGGPILTVDAGSFAWTGGRLSAADLPQQQRKAELILDSFALSGIDAVAPGASDLALGAGWLQQAAAARKVPLIAANLDCQGAEPFEGSRKIERDGVTVGVIGVLAASQRPQGCQVTDPVAALNAELAKLGGVDLVVALTHGSHDEDQALAQAVPAIDLVVNGHAKLTRDEPLALPGAALQLGAGARGKMLGIARVTLVPGGAGFSAAGRLAEGEEKLARFRGRLEDAKKNLAEATDDKSRQRAERQITFYTEELARIEAQQAEMKAPSAAPQHRLVNALEKLEASVADHPATAALLAAAKADIAALEARSEVAPLADTPFVGSAACSGCHAAQSQQWAATPHAHAWQTLLGQNRAMDRDCFGCHVTGAFSEVGPRHPSQVTDPLKVVGCESCHGPGRDHIADPAQARLTAQVSPETCTQCHDGARDGGRFDLATYLPRVAH